MGATLSLLKDNQHLPTLKKSHGLCSSGSPWGSTRGSHAVGRHAALGEVDRPQIEPVHRKGC